MYRGVNGFSAHEFILDTSGFFDFLIIKLKNGFYYKQIRKSYEIYIQVFIVNKYKKY